MLTNIWHFVLHFSLSALIGFVAGVVVCRLYFNQAIKVGKDFLDKMK